MTYNLLLGDVPRPTVPLALFKMVKEMPELFWEDIHIKTVYGVVSGMIWAGGRVPKSTRRYSVNQLYTLFKLYNDLGISVRLTTTNVLLKEEHLRDAYCNTVLRVLSEVGYDNQNGLSVASPILEEYVRDKYPRLYIDKSVVCLITTVNQLQREIDKERYNLVVPYTFVPFKQEFLDMDSKYKSHTEILCNSCVSKDLTACRFHYELVSSAALSTSIEHPEYNKCFAEQFNEIESDFLCGGGKRSTEISPADILKLYIPNGFENFKLSCREADNTTMLNTFLKYSLKDYNEDLANEILRDYLAVVKEGNSDDDNKIILR